MNIKALAEQMGLDEPEYADLLQLFVDTSAADLIKLEQAVSKGGSAAAAAAAHSLKGASLNMGLTEFAEIAGQSATAIRQDDMAGALPCIHKMNQLLDELARLIGPGTASARSRRK